MTLPQQILNILDASPLPVSTPTLIAALVPGRRNNRTLVWNALTKLHRAGLVAKQTLSTARSSPRGLCHACKRPRVLAARQLCHRCRLDNPRTLLDAPLPNCGHTVTYWTAT